MAGCQQRGNAIMFVDMSVGGLLHRTVITLYHCAVGLGLGGRSRSGRASLGWAGVVCVLQRLVVKTVTLCARTHLSPCAPFSMRVVFGGA